MKKLLLIAFLCQLTVFAAEIPSTNFERDLSWQQILQKAKAENKCIFVDCYATWCGPCKQMDADVYPNPGVANILNTNFVSVKVQMDRTPKDNAQTRNWYSAADTLKEKYGVDAFPTFLFFSPAGVLLQRNMGYQSPNEFSKIATAAKDLKNEQLYSRAEAYQLGAKDYADLGKLALFTQTVLKKKYLARRMAQDYKSVVLDQANDTTLCTPEVFEFISQFSDLITTGDRFFALCYGQPDKLTQVAKTILGPGIGSVWTEIQVENAIRRDELMKVLVQDGKPAVSAPDWTGMEADIARKYPKIDSAKLVLDFKIYYYRWVDVNWVNWAAAKTKVTALRPPKNNTEIMMNLNNSGAWDAFLNCATPSVLEQALAWTDLAIAQDPAHRETVYWDTKANLLYKLGRREAARDLEKQAAAAVPSDESIQQNALKMERGLPTWPPEVVEQTEELFAREIYPMVEHAAMADQAPDWAGIEAALAVRYGPELVARGISLAKTRNYYKRDPAKFATELVYFTEKYENADDYITLNKNAGFVLTYSVNRGELETALTWSKRGANHAVNKQAFLATCAQIEEKLHALR